MWMWSFFYNNMDCVIEPENGKGGVYVGSKQAADNITELNKKGIKAVLCVAANITINYNAKNIEFHKIIPAEDLESFDLGKYFNEGISFIEERVSRSGAMLVAYLMKTQKKNMNEALELAKKKRSVIFPNNGFRIQLEKFERELKEEEMKKAGDEGEKRH